GAGIADQHRPEARLADAMPLPDIERHSLEALEQGRQPAGAAMIDAQFMDHGNAPIQSDLSGDARRPQKSAVARPRQIAMTCSAGRAGLRERATPSETRQEFQQPV